MIRFALGALLINGVILAILVLGRHQFARFRLPGLWRLGGILLAILLTLGLAEVTLL